MDSSKKYLQIKLAQSSSFDSDIINLEDDSMVSVQVSVANGSSLNATAKIQVSNNPNNGWSDIGGTDVNLPSTSGVQIYDITETSMTYIRVSFTITSGYSDFYLDWIVK